MSAADCRIDKEKITVGDHLLLSCSGNNDPEFLLEKSAFKLTESQKYNIKVFKAKSTGVNEFSLDFTIYSPGDYKLSDLILTDGAKEINLSGSAVKVESVIKPGDDGKPPEPFGSLLPIRIATPIYYYILLIAFVLITGFYAAYRIRRYSYYKKLKEKLKQYNSPVDADTQFYKSLRMVEKAGYPLDQVERAFRLYNLRAYQLPMFDLTNERVLKYFKRNFPQHKNTRLMLHKLLGEFEELQKNNDLTSEAKSEFIKKLYRYVSAHKGLNV